MANRNSDPLYQAYLNEKARLWREERIRLTEQDFLDTVDPTRSHSADAAKKYMNKLRTGEWRSNTVRARVEDENNAAGLYNVLYADRTGKVVASANVQLPLNRSLLDAYTSGDLRASGDKYVERRYAEQGKMTPQEKQAKGIDSEFRRNTRGLKIAGVKRMQRSRKQVEIVRRRKK